METENKDDIDGLNEKLKSLASQCENLVVGITNLKKQAESCVEEVCQLCNPSLRQVQMYNTSVKLDDLCTFITHLQNELDSRPDINKMANQIQLHIPYMPINTSTNTLRYLTGDNPWNFWLEDTSPEIKILNKLLIEKVENGHLENFLNMPEIGDSVCYLERRKVCRGHVVQHLGNDRLKIINADTSGIAVTSLDKTYKIDSDVCYLNARVIKCCLSEDFDNIFLWSPDLGRMFTNFLHNRKLFVKICKELPGPVPHFVVQIIAEHDDEEDEEEAVNINEWIVSRVLPELKDVFVEGVETLCDLLSPKALDPYFQEESHMNDILKNHGQKNDPNNSCTSNNLICNNLPLTKTEDCQAQKTKSPSVADLIQRSLEVVTNGCENNLHHDVLSPTILSSLAENSLDITETINSYTDDETKIKIPENNLDMSETINNNTEVEAKINITENNLGVSESINITEDETKIKITENNLVMSERINMNTKDETNKKKDKVIVKDEKIKNLGAEKTVNSVALPCSAVQLIQKKNIELTDQKADKVSCKKVGSSVDVNNENDVKIETISNIESPIKVTDLAQVLKVDSSNVHNADIIKNNKSFDCNKTNSSMNSSVSEESEAKETNDVQSEESVESHNSVSVSASTALVANPISLTNSVSFSSTVSASDSTTIAMPSFFNSPVSVANPINNQNFLGSKPAMFHLPSTKPIPVNRWNNNNTYQPPPFSSPPVPQYGPQFVANQVQSFVPEQSQFFNNKIQINSGNPSPLGLPPSHLNPYCNAFVPYQRPPFFPPPPIHTQWSMQQPTYQLFQNQMPVPTQLGNLSHMMEQLPPLYPQWSNGLNTQTTVNCPVQNNNILAEQEKKCKDNVKIHEVKAGTPIQECTEDTRNRDLLPKVTKVTENFHVNIKNPRTLLKPGENLQVMMAHCNSPAEFYVHVISKENSLIDKLRNDMLNYYNAAEPHVNEGWEDAQKTYGTYCACKWAEDDHWYRVEVINWNRDGKVWAHFVDYGNHDAILLSTIQPLAKQFTQFPMMAQPCHLANISPVGTEWSDESKAFFQTLFSEHDDYTAVVVPNTSNFSSSSLGVKLYLNNDTSDEMNTVNHLLVQAGFAQTKFKSDNTDNSDVDNTLIEGWNDFEPMNEDFNKTSNCYDYDTENAHLVLTGYKEKDTSNVCRFFAKDGKCWKNVCRQKHIKPEEPVVREDRAFQELKLPEPGEIIPLKITHVVTVGRIYGQLTSPVLDANNEDEETLESLSTFMNKRNNIRQLKHLESPPALGQLVIAKSTSAYWFRGRVLSGQDDGEVLVLYVDYGTEERVLVDDLRQMEPKYLHLPFQAVECTLANVSESSDNFKRSKGINFLLNHFIGEVVHAKVFSSSPSQCRLEIYLLDSKHEDIGEWLIEKGYCERKNPLTKYHNSLVTLN